MLIPLCLSLVRTNMKVLIRRLTKRESTYDAGNSNKTPKKASLSRVTR